MLSRYVRRYFVRFFSLALGACTGLMVLITVLDRMDEFLERHVLWQDAALYVVLRLPQSAWQMTPAAFLLASVLTFGALSKHRELLAMQAAGVAPLRLVRPLLVLGGMGCLAMLVAREALLPAANQASRLLWRTRIRHEKLDVRLGLFRQGQIWYRAGNRVWHVQHSQPLEGRLLGVTIYELDAEGTLRRRYDAAEARWQGGGWLLRQGTLHAFTAEGDFAGPPERFAERRLAADETPAAISALRREPEEMGIRAALAQARRLRQRGIAAFDYLVAAHGDVAFAAACVLLAGFGLPLTLRVNRRGSLLQAIGLSLLCGFVYWVVHALATALGYHGYLAPALAAWSANGCLAAGSLGLVARLR